MSEHIVSIKVYVIIFVALMLGTALTVWAGLQDFPGQLNVIIALTIAVTKGTLVVLYFMHVRYSSRLVWIVFASALFWLAILFALTLSDYWTRDWFKSQLDTISAPSRQLNHRTPDIPI
jgi:cytochrome c oxidase subunit 4